ncbi:hypothetical protein Barb6_01532 [Bacteroidales bacterium Barb6]|nr:hypothetical protein Barb6_01532 [Bacteroidales bacterium Barb6]
MSKRLVIGLLFCLCGTGFGYAQWTAKDSVWLQNVLSGKDSIRFNPETMRAIREGSFLNTDKPTTTALSAPLELPVLMDFSEYMTGGNLMSPQRKVALKDLPVQVFWQWNPETKAEYALSDKFFDFMESIRQTKPARQLQGLGVTIEYYFAGTVEYAFNPKYRQIAKNRENAVSYKSYNSLPSRELAAKQHKYREEHPDKVIPAIKSNAKQSEELPLPLVILKGKKDVLATRQSSAEPDSISGEATADSLDCRTLRP